MNKDKISPPKNDNFGLEHFLDNLFKALSLLLGHFKENFTMITIVFSSSLFIATTNWHVRAIIPITSQISGFYLFCFTMLSVINVFASIVYEKNKTIIKLIFPTIFTILLSIVVYLFLKEINTEVYLGLASRTANMKKSQIVLITGIIISILGVIRGWIKLFIRGFYGKTTPR